MGTPRARELHVPAPHPRAPSDALDLKTLEERLREFKAENQLLGRTLQEVQALAYEARLRSCKDLTRMSNKQHDMPPQQACAKAEEQALRLA
ncbi:hypothetical protein HaLaN_19136 [Haematococcus lacustris]|uniref:Uncharacterized protein n=1 Tax=Haematococcus lacustris TaxID=44745 RepID=A0A699ZHQ5_HAELA|nr:hypothetical protein HaLaN_19136 [Haematococcus lacustris]